MAEEAENYWIVGSTFGGSDEQLDRFLEEGVWEIHTPSEKDAQSVRSMRVGDPIAIKSTFVRKYDLPFENNNQPVSVLRIKARGRVSSNPGDGTTIEVDWARASTFPRRS